MLLKIVKQVHTSTYHKFMSQLKQAQISTYGRSMTTLYYCALNHQSGFQNYHVFFNTVRPRDTQPQAARTLQVHIFKLGPKKFELNEFM